MNSNDSSRPSDTHAFIGGSNYSWRNYSLEQLEQRRISYFAQAIGTALHEYAAKSINDRWHIQKSDKHSVLRYLHVEKKIPSKAIDINFLFPNLMTYVNDTIEFGLNPEVELRYSDYCGGTADAINFDKGLLQISDLKTGVTPASFAQLENYAAFYCLKFNVNPNKIDHIIFRIYQNNEVLVAEPPSSILIPIIDQVVEFNRFLTWFDEG